jgi:hypothetical protein
MSPLIVALVAHDIRLAFHLIPDRLCLVLPIPARISFPIAFASYFMFRLLLIILPIYQLWQFSILFSIYLLVIFAQLGPMFHALVLVIRAHVSAANCSTMALASGFASKRPSFKQKVLMITLGGELSTAAMQKVVANKSSVCVGDFSPTSMPIPAPFQLEDVDINGSPFIIDAPSSDGSNNFDGFHEQSDTQLLPTSHEPPTKKQKFLKKMYLNPKPWLYFLDVF